MTKSKNNNNKNKKINNNTNKNNNKPINKLELVLIIILVLVVGFFLIYCGKLSIESLQYNRRINQILSDDKEIERKWLIRESDIPYNLKDINVHVYDIQQTYLSYEPEMRVRNYNNGESYEFTIKDNLSKDGLVRDEYNLEIDKEKYENLLKKREGVTIHKTRYQFYEDGQLIAIDIFHDDLDGLAYMEIEFPSKEESDNFKDPDWVIKDVTDDVNYKNGHLARFGIPEQG